MKLRQNLLDLKSEFCFHSDIPILDFNKVSYIQAILLAVSIAT